MNRYSIDEVLLEHKKLLEESGLQVPEDTHLIKGFLRTIAEFKKRKVPFESFFVDVKAWADLAAFNTKLGQLKAEGCDFDQLTDLVTEMGRVGLGAMQLRGFLEVQRMLNELQINDVEPFELTRTILNQVKDDPDKFCALYFLLDCAKNAQTVHNRVAELQSIERELKGRIERQQLKLPQ